MTPHDIPYVIAIQDECYVLDAIESEAIIRARLVAAPTCAWIAEDMHGVCAYLVGYPSELGKITPLGGNFSVPPVPTCLYLHDLAVGRRVAGQRIGSRLVAFALDEAHRRRLWACALVSVQESMPFWQDFGFEECKLPDPAQAALLGTYPGPACYMVRT